MRIITLSLTVLCTVLTAFGLYAQDLRPATLIKQAETETSFEESYNLFVPDKSAAPVDALTEIGADYEVFHLNKTSLDDLRESAPERLELTLPGKTGKVSLVRANIFADGFRLTDSGTDDYIKTPLGLHYRGTVAGEEGSLVAISVFDNEMSGIVATDAGNLVLGKLTGKDGRHVLYNDRDLPVPDLGECATPDSGLPYSAKDLAPLDVTEKDANNCVNVYLEVDYSIYQGRGNSMAGATSFATGLFNQVAVLYANEQINLVMSELYVWSSQDPYNSGSSGGNLIAFRANRTSFNGNIAHLLSFQASGGIAYVDALCSNGYGYGFSSVNNNFQNVPTYSWTVNVVAHELGHNFGSQHTHACVWNGNNTPIDGCYAPQGGCARPSGPPSGGGTIMSYCHLTSAGVNLNKGFGAQPGNLIRNRAHNGSCLTNCTPPGGGGGGGGGGDACQDNPTVVTIRTDNYPGETTWLLKNESGATVASGGPYASRNTSYTKEVCLPDGCYTFDISDSYGDGICCAYGNGAYSVNINGTDVVSGGKFTNSDNKNFCAGGNGDDSDNGGGDDDDSVCSALDFGAYSPGTYGGGQDRGQVTVVGNNEIQIRNNAWKSVALDYTVTANTIIEFDFGSTVRGEIHGIGFDNNSTISSNRTFSLFGTQGWGIRDFQNYTTLGTWKTYSIPVGQFYTGTFNRLFFTADHDGGSRNGNSVFRNVRIYEGSACVALLPADGEPIAPETQATVTEVESLSVFPNPASSVINLDVSSPQATNANLRIVDMTGRTVRQLTTSLGAGEQRVELPVDGLPVGTYLLRLEADSGYTATAKFTVAR